MIVVGMRVDEVGDRLVGHALDGCGYLLGQGRRGIDDHHASRRDDKTGLDKARDHDVVGVTNPLETISLGRLRYGACLLGKR